MSERNYGVANRWSPWEALLSAQRFCTALGHSLKAGLVEVRCRALDF